MTDEPTVDDDIVGFKVLDWKVLPPDVGAEVVDRIMDLMANCDHDWGGWKWTQDSTVTQGDTVFRRGGWAKQCSRCHSWLFDIFTNALLGDR
jgi:hypothetical protein